MRSTAWATSAPFGPHPDRVFPLLHEHGVACVRGNYDDSIGRGWPTASAATPTRATTTSPRSATTTRWPTPRPANRAWLRTLPGEIRFELGGPPRAALPRQPAADERVPLGIDDADALPRRTCRRARGRRDLPHAHGHQVAARRLPAAGSSSTSASWAGPRTTAGPTSGTRC